MCFRPDNVYKAKITFKVMGTNPPIIHTSHPIRVIQNFNWFSGVTTLSATVPVQITFSGNPQVSSIVCRLPTPCKNRDVDKCSVLSGSASFLFAQPGTTMLQFITASSAPTRTGKDLVFQFNLGNGGSTTMLDQQTATTTIGEFQLQASYT